MRCHVLVILIFLSVTASGFAQDVHLSGMVRERGTNEAIPGASLAIMGAGRGARANREGSYRLTLESGKSVRIRITAIGYRPDTISVTLTKDSSADIALATLPLGGATITVTADASRNEAERIMHKVIDSKDAWQSQIKDYQFQVYARSNVRANKDTSSKVIAILESTAEGFWKRNKGYAERITARKETANLPVDANQSALFDVDNFYNERIDVGDYSVVSPVAHDAFDRYDFDLVGDGMMNGSSVYKISVEPSSNLFPAFHGTLWIDKTDYTITYLDLSPNNAIKIGPIKDVSIIQTFSLFENKFWMPSQMTYGFAIKLDLPVIPSFHIEQNSLLQNYTFNSNLNDSIFLKRHEIEPKADSVDSLHWSAIRVIPLATDEDLAYRKFDSVAAVKVAAHGFLFGSFLSDFIGEHVYEFDRVESSRFELSKKIKFSDEWPLSASGFVAYGLGDKEWKYSATLTQGLTWTTSTVPRMSMSLSGDISKSGDARTITSATSAISASAFDRYSRRGEAYDPAINTLTALLLHNDYPDYYHAKGLSASYSNNSLSFLDFDLSFRSELQSSLASVTDRSLLLTSDHFRPNPAIVDGNMHEIALGATSSLPIGGTWECASEFHLAYSDKAIGSDFNFTTAQVDLTIEGKDAGWGRSWLHLMGADRLSGLLPSQSLFYFESRNVVLAPRDVFRTMSPLEFQGDRVWSAMFEQNFYDLPTRLVGIELPDLYWFGFANAAGADLSSNKQLAIPVTSLDSPFFEAGFGVGNIFNILRFDATWRITHRVDRNFFVTGTLAISF